MSTVELPRMRPEAVLPPTGEREDRTLADLVARLGDVPLNRIRLRPFPGLATEQDVLAAGQGLENRYCELIDGALVEKTMGFSESRLAALILCFLDRFLADHNWGILLGADGATRLEPGVIRAPDVSYYSWQRLPNQTVPTEPIPAIAPDLAIEVISRSNTAAEMERKRRDYFSNGVRLVWEVSAETRSVVVYRSLTESVSLSGEEVLTGGDVLPGFSLSVRELFDKALGSGPAA